MTPFPANVCNRGCKRLQLALQTFASASANDNLEIRLHISQQHQAIGTWLCDYADSQQTFDKLKHQQTYKEVVDVANGLYDWKIERGRGGIYL